MIAPQKLLRSVAAVFFLTGFGSLQAQLANPAPIPHWIQSSEPAAAQPVFFRKKFEAETPLLKAILLAATPGKIVLFLNGEALGELEGDNAAASLDLTAQIRPGTNLLAVRAENVSGPARFSLLLELNADVSGQNWILSDATWLSSNVESEGWTEQNFPDRNWIPAVSTGSVNADPDKNPFDPRKSFDAYNSWKLALGSPAATHPATFTLLPGFDAELLRSALPEEDSWVALAFDPQGRLTVAREKRGLLRFTLGTGRVEKVEVINDTLLECRGLLYAHGALYVNANNSKGFYRLRDTKHDGQFDEIKLLLQTSGGVGHGRNSVVAGPDGHIWLVHGNDVHLPAQTDPQSPLKNFHNDAVIPGPFDDAMFDGTVLLPAGHILRTDPEGSSFEVFAGGFRNPLDIGFNRDGEMFTFDADMEWDVGAPWYRPNRVNHVISGADFGWRRGTSKWPDYLPDTLPSTLDIGLASPTGVEFGTGSHFPPRYQDAFYIADWAYGRILAVHPQPNGASYSATSELFLSGRPLNVTDLTFGPDGALYFITGGRRTQSGLYRVSYTGPITAKDKTPAELEREAQARAARELRQSLEEHHRPRPGSDPMKTIDFIWPHLGHSDVWIRHAARVALEHQDGAHWQARALAETDLDIALTAMLALARAQAPELKTALFQKLSRLRLRELNPGQQLFVCRIYEIACARLGKPDPEECASIQRQLDSIFPAAHAQLNHRLCALLVYFESPAVLGKTFHLLAATEKPEDLLQYLFYLRYVQTGWTPHYRLGWFQSLERAEQKPGARDYYSVLQRIREDMFARISPEERERIERSLAPDAATVALQTSAARPFLKDWRMADFNLTQPLRGRSFAQGKAALAQAQCLSCHRFGTEGSPLAPDLTAIASRFDRRALLESILEPSNVIDEKFVQTIFTLKEGSEISGAIEREDENHIQVRHGMFSQEITRLAKTEIAARELSQLSPMPSGLLNSLTHEEILDLLAFLEAAGDADHPAFQK